MNWRLTCALLVILMFKSGRGKSMVCNKLHLKMSSNMTDNDAPILKFDDLSPGEMIRVKNYLKQNLKVPLVDAPEAKSSDNCIYSIVLQLPPKADVLKFLDQQGIRPTREALEVVYFGNQKEPNITEYMVGPLPEPTYHKDVTVQKYGGKLPYYRRVQLRTEMEEVNNFLKNKVFTKAPNFMYKAIDSNGINPYPVGLPPGLKSGERKIWLTLYQNVSGYYLHPIGLEVQVDLSSLDASQWKVLKVFYNGQYFENMEDLECQYNQGHLKVVKVKKAPSDGEYSRLNQRVPHTGPGPLHYEPRGPHYRIRNNQVDFMSLSFAFGMDAYGGPRVFDIRFKGERIVYELSLQDASAIYGCNSPASMLTRVEEWTLGAVHTHNINFKVDMDVDGVKNSLLANDMAFETVKAPWSPQNTIHRMRMVKKVLRTEDQAAFRLNEKMPRYMYFAANSTNKWGLNRGYRIQIVSFSGDHLPESDPMERAISWGRYKLAVTKRKESEPVSTCPYNQMDPWTPSVAFADFINNETIVNEDLVAWITLGFLHIPHSEDIPNTVTLGNVVGFLLRPYNYYDDDPSIYSPDSVFLSSEQDPTSCEVNHLACLPKVAACVPNFPPFTYEPLQNLTRP